MAATFNIIKSRELLLARLRKEAGYFLSDLGLARKHSVVPFVVVCRQRTGSNMLRYALETHPRVVHYGELFHPARKGISGAHGRYAYQPKALLRARRADARSFLNTVIWRDVHPAITAVGFKLFYHHGRDDGPGNPWPVIIEREDIRVIHLVRKDPIAAFMSHERIRRHEPYVQVGRAQPPSRPPDGPVVLDIERLAGYLTDYSDDIQRFEHELAGRTIHEVTYEDLCGSGDAIQGVLEFLGVEARALRFQTERQSTGSLATRVANLDQAVALLRGTRWERFHAAPR
jgi:hypothetical protein